MLDDILSDIKVTVFDKDIDVISNPTQVAPLKYICYGDFFPKKREELRHEILKFQYTPLTMVPQPIRDLQTGEITDFKDIPISTLPSDSSEINRLNAPMSNYVLGSTSGTAFMPGGIDHKDDNFHDKDKYIQPLDTGLELLTTPFRTETVKVENTELPELLDDAEEIEPSPLPVSTVSNNEKDISYAVVDDWDVSNFEKEVPNPALTFKFALDDFQLRALYRLEKHSPVFVSAPTSAGKTVVAQYAIQLSKFRNSKVIYTSPIKALSNQKYRDFKRQFGDVGILTGDVSLNTNAQTLIMTTEILSSMLYHGADIIRDIDCVIFDECHYISDVERGVVWEESIILMPDHINMVFLSATVPNSLEIARWIGRTKQKTVYVIDHHQRPVPLEHYIYGGNNILPLYSLQNKSRKFNDYNLKKETDASYMDETHDVLSQDFWIKFMTKVAQKNYFPMLVFCFSRALCQRLACMVQSMCLITEKQVRKVKVMIKNVMSKLSKKDQDLPQVLLIFNLLEKGIGFHHSGMIPILKELVEILLSDGLLAVLFCTSTFAMGINVPVRCTTFVSLKKFNGKTTEMITPTEYTQMCGRAGRRGLDEKGISIILMFRDKWRSDDLLTLFEGSTDKLDSKFKLKFNMILNILKTRNIQVNEILRMSLGTDKQQNEAPHLKRRINEINNIMCDIEDVECPYSTTGENVLDKFGEFINSMKRLSSKIYSLDKYLLLERCIPGTYVYVLNENPEHVLIKSLDKNNIFTGINKDGDCIKFGPDQIGEIFLQKNNKKNIDKSNSFPDDFTSMESSWTNIAKHMIEAFEISGIYTASQQIICANCVHKKKHMNIYTKKHNLLSEKNELNNILSDESLKLKPLLDKHYIFLKQMKYIDEEMNVMIKGRVAMEINSIDEVLGTELLFSSAFDNLTPSEIVAVVGALCCVDTKIPDTELVIPDGLGEKLDIIKSIIENLDRHLSELKISDGGEIHKYMNVYICNSVFMWAEGVPLIEILKVLDVEEGIFIRIINRISRTLRNFAVGSRMLGRIKQSEGFKKADELILRGIVVLPSLYLE